MIQLIVGNEGKGKTKEMLDKVNEEIKAASGNIVYLDKNAKHMYELNNKIRLVDVSEFNFASSDEFYGFICGIMSQDHDLEQLYFDNFKRIGCVKDDAIEAVLSKFEKLSEKTNVDFCFSMAVTEAEVPDSFKDKMLQGLSESMGLLSTPTSYLKFRYFHLKEGA